METPPADSDDSTPPAANAEEPVPAVPTSETTPVWAHTVPVEPADISDEPSPGAAVEEDEALPALPMQKGDPDWSKTDPSANGEGKKPTPAWASTVPTSPGETIPEAVDAEASTPPAVATEPPPPPAATEPPAHAVTEPPAPAATEPPAPAATEPPADDPLTQPLKAVAADATRSTFPPAAEGGPAPAEETDIWPPEPPTEPAMPAWPPLSELGMRAHPGAEEPGTPPQAIPSWPDSFDPETAPTVPPAPAKVAPAASATPAPMPAPTPAPVAPAPPAPPAATPPAAAASPAPAPPAPTPAAPVTPAPAPTSRPAWAPGPVASPAPTPSRQEGNPMQVPAWAPHVPLAGEPGKPTWFSPQEAIPHATAQPLVQPTAPEPPPTSTGTPPGGGHLPVAQIPATPATPGTPGAPVAPAQPGRPAQAAQPAAARGSWEVVEQHGKTDKNARASVGVTAEDRSYAEWFAWAKRGGAPASACHAAAQGAFKALSSGKDVMTAVQWATAAMSQPPENVSYARQTYCAWFSLANIDLNLDQHRSHLFAAGAVQALDAGQDPAGAHAAGLAAAGIR